MFINLQKYKNFRNYKSITQAQKNLFANRLTDIAQQCFLLQGRPRQRKESPIPHFEELRRQLAAFFIKTTRHTFITFKKPNKSNCFQHSLKFFFCRKI